MVLRVVAGLPHVLLPVLALPRLSSSSSQPGQVLMVQVSSKRGTEVLRVSGGLGLELATVTLSPVDLECSWVEGFATGRDPGWAGLRSLRPSSSTSRLRSVCHCWPEACRCSVHNDLCVATTCVASGWQGVGGGEKRAQLNTWA